MEDLNGELVKAHPDLFIVVTMNPPTYEGVKDLPDPIKSRLTKRYKLDYPPPKVEMTILKSKMKLTDHEFNFTGGVATGKYANDITDVMKVVTGLRKQTDLSYTPSMRETQGFIQDLKEGDNFFTAFARNIGNWYYGDEKNIVDEALNSVRKR
jgi:MoxR-like ATPase